MFNPCYPFTTELLESMIRQGVVYFVRSTFTRGLDKNAKGAFLISHYHDRAEAERHYNAIAPDQHRFLYNATIPVQLEKLKMAAAHPEGYNVCSKIMIPGIENRISAIFREHTKRYLHQHTNWELKGRVTITPFLYFQLGELYTRIVFNGDEIRIKFDELENA